MSLTLCVYSIFEIFFSSLELTEPGSKKSFWSLNKDFIMMAVLLKAVEGITQEIRYGLILYGENLQH